MESHEKHQKTPRKQPIDSIPQTSIPNLNASNVNRRESYNVKQKVEQGKSRLEELVEQLRGEPSLKSSDTPGRTKSTPRRAKTPGAESKPKTPSRSRTPHERLVSDSSTKKKDDDYLQKYQFYDDKEIIPPDIIRSKTFFASSPIYSARRHLTPKKREVPVYAPAMVRVSMGELLAKHQSKQQITDDDLKRMDAKHRDIKERYYTKQREYNLSQHAKPEPTKTPKTPISTRAKTPNSSAAKRRAVSVGRQNSREKITNLQKEWEHLINLADEELTKTAETLNDDLTSPTPHKSRYDHDKHEADFLVGKMYEKNLEYWDQQAMSENPSYGSRVPDPRHGYLSSYAKRHSIKRFLDRNPEKQDCMRRKLIFTPGKKEHRSPSREYKEASSIQDQTNGDGSNVDMSEQREPLFKTSSVQERLDRLRKSSEKKRRKSDIELASEDNSKISSSLLSEVGSSPVRKALLKKELFDFGNKYIVLDVMKKRLLSHEHVKEFVTRVIEENDVDTMQILIKDPKIRHMMVESLGELVLVKMMSDVNRRSPVKRSSTPYRKNHEPPVNKLYLPKEKNRKAHKDEENNNEVERKDKKKLEEDLVGALRYEYLNLIHNEKKNEEERI
jgi:hypothetical protein